MVNNGNGYFTPLNPGLFPVNNRSADDVALADLNGDGNLDVVGGDNLSTIRVSLGNGNGTFGAATSYSGAGGFISDLELGDMDGDGVLDIVSTNGAGSVAFFKGNANGTFQARVAITAPDTPQTIELADVTNDGVLDIIGSGTHSGTTPVFVLVGNGNGTFQAPRTTTSSVNPREIAVGDFDGDGVPDVVGQSYGGNIRVFLSQSSVQTTTSDFSLTTVARAQGAVTLFNTIQDQLTVEKGRTAAAAVRLESGLSNADAMRSLFSDASDRIRDIDAAEELAKYTALSVRSTIQSALFAHIMDGPSILSLLGQ
jgi:flagellin-like hook-associated protein FlgL